MTPTQPPPHRFAATLHIAFCFVLICCFAHRSLGAERAKQPNVLFILVDDLGWTDLGCFGSSFYETPNIDRLAATATRFTSAYAACPVCSPTRASILTGRYPQRLGITDYINQAGGNQPENWKRDTKLLPAAYVDRMSHQEVTIAEALKAQGYATFFAGKWHLGPEGFWPEDQGFDINMGGIEKGGPYGGKKYFSPYGNPRLADGPEGEHLPARLAQETVKFIDEHRESPFLAYLAFYSVHTPLMTREDLRQKYLAKKQRLRIAGPLWGQEGSRKVRLVQEHAVYAGMVEAMDAAVGKVLDELDRLALTDNTIVVFTSDNGGLSTSEGHPTSNLPLRAGKGWMYEGGIRVPTIVRVPGITTPGSQVDDYISSIDYFPTLMQLASTPVVGTTIDGQSFVSALQGKSFDRGPIFWHYPHYGNQGGSPSAAVRDGNWKLIRWFEDQHLELFNLADDLSEKHEVGDQNPQIRDRLQAALQQWLDDVHAKYPTPR